MKKLKSFTGATLTLLALLASLQQAKAQGTAFTYQGRLDSGTNPANGHYDFTFSLYNASSGGAEIAGPLTDLDVGVTNGLFIVSVDFGPVYNGTSYWLQLQVRTNGNGTFTPLSPLQELTPTPYAVTAQNVTGSVALSQLPAVVQLLNNPGSQNFFAGGSAGNNSLTGSQNTAVGSSTLSDNTTGTDNAALGTESLEFNTTGNFNTGTGIYALFDNTTGSYNTADGAEALYWNSTGSNNTATGYQAMANLPAYVTGSYNTADGVSALTSDDSGAYNTAIGVQALAANTAGNGNIALGYLAGNTITGNSNIDIGNPGISSDNNITRIGSTQTQTYIAGVINGNGSGLTNIDAAIAGGSYNTGVGTGALSLNASGSYNTALGVDSLAFNNSGSSNTAVGVNALGFTGAGANNTALGVDTLFFSSGGGNTAVGVSALFNNRAGYNSVAVGYNADMNNQDGLDTVAIGVSTFQNQTTGNQNTGVGTYAFQNLQAGSGNVGLGYYAGNGLVSGSNNIYIGNPGGSSDNNLVRIGNGQTETILATGALGINTTPSEALEVNGNYAMIDGADAYDGDGPIDAYIGGNGSGSDVQVGSMNSEISNVALYNWGSGNYMNLYCASITITGGSDLAEPFDINSSVGEIPQGSVVVIDGDNPGHLKVSTKPYDTCVAGVLSGANGIHPGIQMHQEGLLEGGKNVALSGRVYVLADASNGAIHAGDMLTTSATPGHAMKVSDHNRAQGAIIGKAMSGLKEGKGMVLVLVTLQ